MADFTTVTIPPAVNTTAPSGSDGTLDSWAIIELFGHSRIAGRVKSENYGSACLIRVDVPEIETERGEYIKDEYTKILVKIASFTKFLGIGSIYALTPVTEELAREAAKHIAAEPVSVFGLESVRRRLRELPEGVEDDD